MEVASISVEEPQWWRVRLRITLPVLVGAMLVCALAALLFYASRAATDRDTALDEQRHSYEVITLVRRLDASMARAESTLSRYVIGMDADTGRLFQEQWRDAGEELKALAFATRTSPWQRASITGLKAAYKDRGALLTEIGLRTTYDQKMAALAQFHQAGQAENLKRIDLLLDRIIKAEQARLRERSDAVNQAGARTKRFSDTYSLVGLALLVSALFAAWVAITAMADRRRARTLAEAEAARADDLEDAVARRTSELSTANARLKEEATERAAAEESLRQMQKMEAVGQLTGGIAHDFNNMLAVVVGGLELAKRKIHQEPQLAERHLDNAMEGANRASTLTRRLLAFARAEPILPSALDADALVTGMTDLIDRTIGDQIKVALDLQAKGWAIFADRHQLENALLNLAVNARDAMDGRGTLTIATRQVTLAAGEVGECSAGDHVRLTVEDTGCGMTPEVLERVFEPFFTTKPVGKGTGLGLSQIFGFVRQCNGEIRMESTPEKGTRVHLYLPRRVVVGTLDNAAQSRRAARDDIALPPTRILIVEDDPRVLTQTIAAIEELGHLPVACDHPAKAAAMLKRHRDVGLIISDVMMPDMTGPEMIRQLGSAHGAIPVLFVTGYTGDSSDSSLFEGHIVLRKPYTLGALAAAISQAISAPHGSQTSAAAE
ncbi:ATP-binding protein [Sphingobium aquiterrae]|uniref:ATP-binding protein n=1 Tax=Sphingobium aquiterrae TaxID=2038656 RepID=UPI0030186C70